MEEDDKGCPMIRMGVSGWVFLLVPAYPGCPGPKAVKRLCVCSCQYYVTSSGRKTTSGIWSASSSDKLMQYTGSLASIVSFANFVICLKSSSVTVAYNNRLITLTNCSWHDITVYKRWLCEWGVTFNSVFAVVLWFSCTGVRLGN